VVVQVIFNELVDDPLSVNRSTFYLIGNGTQDALIKASQEQRSLTLTPAQGGENSINTTSLFRLKRQVP